MIYYDVYCKSILSIPSKMVLLCGFKTEDNSLDFIKLWRCFWLIKMASVIWFIPFIKTNQSNQFN